MGRKIKNGCQWFAMCHKKATTTHQHPILGTVPVCDDCKKFAEESEAR